MPDVTARVTDAPLAAWLESVDAAGPFAIRAADIGTIINAVATDRVSWPTRTWLRGVHAGADRPIAVSFDAGCGRVFYSTAHSSPPGGAEGYAGCGSDPAPERGVRCVSDEKLDTGQSRCQWWVV